MTRQEFHQSIRINNKVISTEAPAYVIAEAGVNHNGDVKLARRMVDLAAKAGVDAIKFQVFRADKLVTSLAAQADYQRQNMGFDQSQLEMLSKLELRNEDFKELQSYSRMQGLEFLATPFDGDSLDFIVGLGVQAIKVSSGDLTNFPFLKQIAAKGLPVILSTGMSTLEEVVEAVRVIKDTGNLDLVLLHCTSDYPCELRDCHLLAMDILKEKTGCLIGYSDHTTTVITPSIAVAMGATVIEKHFTLDKSMAGPDHAASLSPEELKEMVEIIHSTELTMGEPMKKPTEKELKTRVAARKSIVSSTQINRGELISADHILIKRPGNGIQPWDIEKVIGKKAIIDIPADALIEWEWLQ